MMNAEQQNSAMEAKLTAIQVLADELATVLQQQTYLSGRLDKLITDEAAIGSRLVAVENKVTGRTSVLERFIVPVLITMSSLILALIGFDVTIAIALVNHLLH